MYAFVYRLAQCTMFSGVSKQTSRAFYLTSTVDIITPRVAYVAAAAV